MKIRTISDIVGKSALSDRDLQQLRHLRGGCSGETDTFVLQYLDGLILWGDAYRKRTVEHDPELAVRLFETFHDVVIGQYFVAQYKNSQAYRSTAADISLALRHGKKEKRSWHS